MSSGNKDISVEHTLRDLLLQGRSSEHNTSRESSGIEMRPAGYGENVIRVKAKGLVSPRLTGLKFYAAVQSAGGQVNAVNPTTEVSGWGTVAVDIDMAKTEKKPPETFTTVELARFGNAKLYGSRGSNALVLTTEGSMLRLGMSTSEMDTARKWLDEKGLNVKSQTTLSQFHTEGPNVWTEAVAIVLDSKPSTEISKSA